MYIYIAMYIRWSVYILYIYTYIVYIR